MPRIFKTGKSLKSGRKLKTVTKFKPRTLKQRMRDLRKVNRTKIV